MRALQTPGAYPHPTGRFRVIETHISWVILTGRFAYKIKKPVNLGFLDFSTLEKRKRFCEEEVRVNRRLCPEIYWGVVPITGTADRPSIGGNGAPLEYAVKMRQFDDRLLWDRMLRQGELTAAHIDQLACLIGRFHETAPSATPRDAFGLPATFWKAVQITLNYLSDRVRTAGDRRRFRDLARWMRRRYRALGPRMIRRRKVGLVREGHGDLHLKNIAFFSRRKPRILVFDGIEFDPTLRWIDVMNDVAFLIMDLEHRRRPDLAWRFLNRYLETTGDYEGLALLGFYAAGRALVRAEVTSIRADEEGRFDFPVEARRFLALAGTYGRVTRPRLFITHGFSGCGKTTMTTALAPRLNAIRVRSDVERKRLFGLRPEESSSAALKRTMYATAGSRRTYARLEALAESLLDAGFSVIVDAAFLREKDRRPFADLADRRGVPFSILDFPNSPTVLRRRIRARMKRGRDASEADLTVLEQQLAHHDPLTAAERKHTIRMRRK